jgi:hypothetical protein
MKMQARRKGRKKINPSCPTRKASGKKRRDLTNRKSIRTGVGQ